ncbi:MAG TPA: tetratricopeptide repeat protein, partial [Solirubrobacterales bacterium]|nr:tetratricopeptide repeat protein [Solirubrobacterales bacterium]
RLERGAEGEALAAVKGHDGDFAAAGIAARVQLLRAGLAAEAFASLDGGNRDGALDALLVELGKLRSEGGGPDAAADGGLPAEDARDLLRRAIVGILSDLDPGDPNARAYRRKLASALG